MNSSIRWIGSRAAPRPILRARCLLDDDGALAQFLHGKPLDLLRKRLTLRARIGITSRKRNTAMAEPGPKSLTPPKEVRHIASAITFASSCTDRARSRG